MSALQPTGRSTEPSRRVRGIACRAWSRSLRRRVPLAAVLLLAAAAAGAQPERREITICLFLPDVQTREAETIRLIMDGELTGQLGREGFTVVPEAAWRAVLGQPGAPQGAAAVGLARQMEAQVAITGTIRIEGSQIILGIRGYDVPAGMAVFEIEERAAKDIGIYNQVGSLAQKIIAELNGWLEARARPIAAPSAEAPLAESGGTRPAEISRIPEGAETPDAAARVDGGPPAARAAAGAVEQERPGIRVTLLSEDEAAEIWIEGQRPAGTISGGKLLIEAPPDSVLRIEKRKPGYRADREDFQLADEPVEVSLRPLLRATRLAVEVFYSSSQFLGLGVGLRLYLIPDYLMLKVDQYSYFSLGSQPAESSVAYHGDFRLAAGSYLFSPPSRRVRFGLAAGLGVILSVFGPSETRPDRATYQDLYLEPLELWLDLNWERWAVFFRAETKYALGLGNGILERGFVTDYGPQYTIGWLFKW